jgi:hypothetical protein
MDAILSWMLFIDGFAESCLRTCDGCTGLAFVHTASSVPLFSAWGFIIAFGDFELTPQGTGIRNQLHLTVHSWLVIDMCSGCSMSGTRNATPN